MVAVLVILGLASAIAGSLSKNSVGPGPGPNTENAAGAVTILRHAARASASPAPYSGTSEITYSLPPSNAPSAAARDLAPHKVVSRYSYGDSTHWWLSADTLEPALQREEQVAVADGARSVWYRGLTNTALAFPVQPNTGSGLFTELQGSHAVAQNLQQFVATLSRSPGERVKVLRQARVRLPGDPSAGRLTDVLQASPLVRESGSCSGKARCAQKSSGFGRALYWIQRSDGMVLRYQEYGLPGSGEFPQHFVYKVTSLKAGGPTPAQLSYHPPVTPTSASGSTGAAGGGSVGGSLGSQWTAPPGLLSLPAPTDAHGYAYTSCGSGQGSDAQGNPTSADVLFVNGWKSGPLKGRICTHPFVYIQEQLRAQGLPPALKIGAPHLSGVCTSYAGTYRDGLHWLALDFDRPSVTRALQSDALQQAKVDVLAVADKLDRKALIKYVDRVCK